MKRFTKSTWTWVASGVVAVALLVGCGDTIATQADRRPSLPNVEFERMAEAEQFERSAHLDGQAWTYFREPRSTHQASELVPGSRHMPTR